MSIRNLQLKEGHELHYFSISIKVYRLFVKEKGTTVSSEDIILDTSIEEHARTIAENHELAIVDVTPRERWKTRASRFRLIRQGEEDLST